MEQMAANKMSRLCCDGKHTWGCHCLQKALVRFSSLF